jgi:hypothetical protein
VERDGSPILPPSPVLIQSPGRFFKGCLRLPVERGGSSLVRSLGAPCRTVSEGVALVAWSDGGAILLDMSCLLANKAHRANDFASLLVAVLHFRPPLGRVDGFLGNLGNFGNFVRPVEWVRGVGEGRIGVSGADLVGGGGHCVCFFLVFVEGEVETARSVVDWKLGEARDLYFRCGYQVV